MKQMKLDDFLSYETENLVILDFYADWCGPCKALEPTIKKLLNTFEDVEIFKINVDDQPDFAASYNIRSIPTLVYFKNKIKVDSDTGNKTYEYLVDKINDLKK